MEIGVASGHTLLFTGIDYSETTSTPRLGMSHPDSQSLEQEWRGGSTVIFASLPAKLQPLITLIAVQSTRPNRCSGGATIAC